MSDAKNPHDALFRAVFGTAALLSALLQYIWTIAHVDRVQLLQFARTHAGPRVETMMRTPAEQCRDEGRAEGEARGSAKTLLKLMQLKFGGVPDDVASAITSGSLDQLERRTERVLSATSAEQVVAGD